MVRLVEAPDGLAGLRDVLLGERAAWSAYETAEGRKTGSHAGRDTMRGAVGENNTFALTLVRVGPFLPYVEADVYEYRGISLPGVGDTITVSRIEDPDRATPDETRAYVTRVDGNAKPPLMATEIKATGRP